MDSLYAPSIFSPDIVALPCGSYSSVWPEVRGYLKNVSAWASRGKTVCKNIRYAVN
jgi:hypothetical protein